MIPAASRLCRRSARMLVAIPSPDSWNSLNVRNPRTIRSRMMSSDQRSPNRSREILTGQPERRFDVGFPGTQETLSRSLAKCKSWMRLLASVGRISFGFGQLFGPGWSRSMNLAPRLLLRSRRGSQYVLDDPIKGCKMIEFQLEIQGVQVMPRFPKMIGGPRQLG